MARVKCTECGQVFDANLKCCPNCGCPASECETVKEESTDKQETNRRNMGIIHENFNERTPYSPISPKSSLFNDPAFLAKYPIGEYAKKNPFGGWLFGPWHLTCNDESNREQYDAINNIFYGFNLIWKAIIYANLWTILKNWVLIVVYIAGIVLLSSLSSAIDNHDFSEIVMFVQLLAGIALYVWLFFTYLFGIGKALHRYWPQFHKTWRRLCKRFVNAMKN